MKQILLIVIVAIFAIACTVWLYCGYKKQKQLMANVTELKFSDILLGDSNAGKTVILYFDYNCGFCKKFFNDVYPQFKTHYIKTGKVNLVLRLVCGLTDKMALRANQTAICINNHGHFDKLHRLLLHESKVMYTDAFNQLIEGYLEANESLGECILDENYSYVVQNIYQFQELESKGTPTFVINNKVYAGSMEYHELIKNLNN